jgi:hypothetical protein
MELLQLLEHLSTDQRDVLTLRLVGDFTVDQIAEVMGRQPGAIKALQHRAVTRLQELVESTVSEKGLDVLSRRTRGIDRNPFRPLDAVVGRWNGPRD